MNLLHFILCLLLVNLRSLPIRAGESCSASDTDAVSLRVAAMEEAVRRAGCEMMPASRCPDDHEPQYNQSYDFIIVGAGIAGSMLANRLSKNDNWTVLLLEAGGCPTRTNDVPGYFTSCQDTDWDFYTNQDEDNCWGMNWGRCRWPRGKVLGGDSGINFNTYLRGHRHDYDRWRDAGCLKWGFDDVLPYFKIHENMKDEEVMATEYFTEYHNTSGELPIDSWNNWQNKKMIEAIESGVIELGFTKNVDCNGESPSGWVNMPGLLERGRRYSAERAFLNPCLNRSNLLIVRNADVQKILITDGVAWGVEYSKNASLVRVVATKEVIVAAGAINSPKLLMLSGIGPQSHLESLDIECLKDLPVGHNLQDHPTCMIGYFTHDCEVPYVDTDNEIYKLLMQKEDCMLSHHGIATNSLLWNSKKWKDDNPDLQLFFFGFQKQDPNLIEYCKHLNFNITKFSQILKDNEQKPVVLLAGSMLKPLSKGRVELNCTDNSYYPHIFCEYYNDKRDVDKIALAFPVVEKLANTSSMLQVNTTFHRFNVTECSGHEQGSRDYMECYVKHMTTTSIDTTQSSTCKMGPEDCGDAVVDPYMKVRGFKGLRVCGSPVYPCPISGTNTATTLMIAERCAEMIKECYNSTG